MLMMLGSNLMLGVVLGVQLMMIEKEQIALRLVFGVNLGLNAVVIGLTIRRIRMIRIMMIRMRIIGLRIRRIRMMMFLGLVTTANG